MQIAFWWRVLLVPDPVSISADFPQSCISFLGPSSVSSSASALFGIVVFRHVPELDASIDLLLSIKRGMILLGCLFALFCTSLEGSSGWGQAFPRAAIRQ